MLQQPNPRRGFLSSVGLTPEILVQFQYNPTQLSDKRTVNYATLNAPAILLPVRQYSQGGDRTFSFTVRLDGLFKGPADDVIRFSQDKDGSIWPELNKYRAFLYPKTRRWQERAARASFVNLYADVQQFVAPPACRFGFGRGRVIDCIVTEVGITELLYNADLQPMRADVSVTLVELSPYNNGQP
jgi:contractile injection system tube protein